MLPSPKLPFPNSSGAATHRLAVCWLGEVEYSAAVDLQQRVHTAVRAGDLPDTLLLLTHPRVITLGRGADPDHVVASEAMLAAEGVALHASGRGGDVTYHGPGQLVGYPILDLNRHGRDVHQYLRRLEESLIQAVARFGVVGCRSPGQTGVWVGDEKIAALGIAVRHWVTWHGFALNVDPRLDDFALIVPCGIRDRGVTSLASLLGAKAPTVAALREPVAAAVAAEFGLELAEIAPADLTTE